MKKLMGGLKGFKAKEFFVNHAEKVAFGFGVLIFLLVLSGTQWARFSKAPQEIVDKVKEAKNRIATSVWPEEKRTEFSLRDFAGQAQEVRGPLSVARYEYSTNVWWPLYRKQELAKEPELLAVLDLQATAGRFALGTAPPAPTVDPALAGMEGALPEGSATNPAAPTSKLPEGFDSQFSPVKGANLPGAPGAAGPGVMGGGAAYPGMAGPIPNYGAAGMAVPGLPEGGAMGMGMGMEGMGVAGMESRGERFIAVRGVWPLWQQMEKIQRALNLQTTNDARNFLQLLDFVLERQTVAAGDNPWENPWEAVDIQRALDVLNEAYDYDMDILDPQIIDTVITMPLPARLVGVWGDYATHPRIEKFTLPPAELERETKLQQKLVEEFEKYKLADEKRNVQPAGFSRQQRNIRSMAQTMFDSEYATSFDTSMTQMINEDPSMRMRLPDLKSRLTAVGRLILFRYMDFDVRPGFAYRYRVRLKLRNPNFERPLDQVLEPSVAEGLERETPWSNESNVAVVPQGSSYFLDDVERDPTNEARPTATKPLAKLDFFEWDATVGTMIHDMVEIKTYGQFISQTRNSLKLDVAKPSFKDTEVTFRSDDLLVDVFPDVRVDPALHTDLQLPPAQRGKVGLLPEAVVVNEAGQLKALDPVSNSGTRKNLITYVQRERAPFENIKNKEDQPQGAMFGGAEAGMPASPYAGAGMPEEMMMMMEGQGKKKSKRGSRKPPAQSSSSQYMNP